MSVPRLDKVLAEFVGGPLDGGALDEALRRILNRAPQAVPVAGFNSAI